MANVMSLSTVWLAVTLWQTLVAMMGYISRESLTPVCSLSASHQCFKLTSLTQEWKYIYIIQTQPSCTLQISCLVLRHSAITWYNETMQMIGIFRIPGLYILTWWWSSSSPSPPQRGSPAGEWWLRHTLGWRWRGSWGWCIGIALCGRTLLDKRERRRRRNG